MTIREGRWKCPHCKSENRGSSLECVKCGSQRGADVEFYLPSGEPEVTEAHKLKEAKAGPDWTCSFCRTDNRATESICSQCGNGKSVGDKERPVVSEFVGDQEKLSRALRRLDSVFPKVNFRLEIDPPMKKNETLSRTIYVSAALLAIASIVLLANYLLTYRAVVVKVVSKDWTRTIQREEYRTLRESSWGIPSGGRLVSQSTEIRSYRDVVDHYEERTRQVSYRERTGSVTRVTGHRNLGNGYFEDIKTTDPVYETRYRTESYREPIYRKEPVYDTRYVYDIERWIPLVPDKTNGVNSEPRWPVVIESQLYVQGVLRPIREAYRKQSYGLSLKAVEGETNYNYTTENESEWNKYHVGQFASIQVNRLGHVGEIRLPEQD